MIEQSQDNKFNEAAYQKMPEGAFDDIGSLPVGIKVPVDVFLALEILEFTPKSCLEMGAGTGRVIEALIARVHPTPQIYAVERIEHFAQDLRKKFLHQPEVSIIQNDILLEDLPEVEVAFWMFAGMSEFTLAQQRLMVSRISETTSKALVVDFPELDANMDEVIGAARIGVNVFEKELPYGEKLYLHIPTFADMQEMQANSQFNSLEFINYNSTTDRKRRQYILRK